MEGFINKTPENFSRIHHDEVELLTILMEECAEVQKAASKIIRFGAYNDKRQDLEDEVGDLMCMVDLLHKYDFISWGAVERASARKLTKLKTYSNLKECR